MADEQYMNRALQLASLGMGSVSPNPMVGCVIVCEGTIIGEGYHERYGELHAEVNAVHAVADRNLLPKSTVYVTLEPCSHHGKTPPCADLLVDCKVKKVIICNNDPNPLVGGEGIQKLRQAGIEVETGLLEERGLVLNRRFFTAMKRKRPYIILKWAQTTDGFVARKNFDSKWISNQYSRQLVHKWRSEEDAILIGTNTAKYDNASLTTRDWKGKNPLRVLLDRNLSLEQSLHLFDGTVPTLCFTEVTGDGRNCEIVTMKHLRLSEVLDELVGRGIQSLIVEGGAKLLQSFIKEGLWDEARVFVANLKFVSGIAAPEINQNPIHEENVLDDKLLYYQNQ
jgi:diaminohydroxyphosphoribosylaminopyrimidine deaminase/5-amino-6-(5-phosphoribosylamino)uracil reductase